MNLTQNIKGSPESAVPSDDPLSKYITEQWNDLKSAYWQYHASIWESLLYYAGNLWIRYDPQRKMYEVDAPADDFTPRPRINRFAGAIDAVASNFQQIPEVEAVATPMDDILRLNVAEVANNLAKHFIKECALRSDYKADEDKVGMAGQWFTLAGCFMTNVTVEDEHIGDKPVMVDQEAFNVQCPECDSLTTLPEPAVECPNCGSSNVQVTPTVTQVPQPGEDGQPLMEPIIEKRIHCEVESPLAPYPNPEATSMANTSLLLLPERMSLDQIWRDFGIQVTADTEYPDGWNVTAENALNFFYMGYSNSTLAGKNSALVIRAYCPPEKVQKYPNGFYVVYVNGKVQPEAKGSSPEKWPFADEHPMTKADFKGLPTKFFARCVAFDLAGLQRELCDYFSIIKLHGLTGAVEPVVVESDSLVSEITGRGDKMIVWNRITPQAKEPHRLQHEQLAPDIFGMIDRIEKYFELISQIVSVFRGEQPGSVKAGVAIESLRSQAEFMFSGPVAAWNNTWKETVRKGVKLIQQHYTMEQLVQILGDSDITAIQQFQQADLDEYVEWISTKSGLPRTRDEKRQEMIELFDRGALDITDPAVKEKAFELFGETGMMSTFSKDASRARFENAMAKLGQPIMTFWPNVDDNDTHLAIHGDQIKSPDFLKWPPNAQALLMQHYDMTAQHISMEQQAEMAAQAALNPKPGAAAPQSESTQ